MKAHQQTKKDRIMKFTLANIIDVKEGAPADGCRVIDYTIGNTDSDFGHVKITLTDAGWEEGDFDFDGGRGKTHAFDADVSTDCCENWGLFAAANAVQVAVTDFSSRFPHYYIIDNTGIGE